MSLGLKGLSQLASLWIETFSEWVVKLLLWFLLTQFFILQLDFSDKLYLAPLTTVRYLHELVPTLEVPCLY